MYDRGFVLERNAEKAVEWYRKAIDGGVAPAKHNLALLLREGRGAPQDGPKAVALLREAALQGMTASMYALGDTYERGGAVLKDPAAALAWFAITAELELQASHGQDTPLSKAAQQPRRVALQQRVMTGADRERADTIGETGVRTDRRCPCSPSRRRHHHRPPASAPSCTKASTRIRGRRGPARRPTR